MREGRLRAGVPAGRFVARRPGTSGETEGVRAAHNDTGIVRLQDGTHLVVAAFLKDVRGLDDERDAVLAGVGGLAYEWAVRR